MKAMGVATFFVLTMVLPAVLWAGGRVARAEAPAMGELGLLALGVGLVGAGVALLRSRRH